MSKNKRLAYSDKPFELLDKKHTFKKVNPSILYL